MSKAPPLKQQHVAQKQCPLLRKLGWDSRVCFSPDPAVISTDVSQLGGQGLNSTKKPPYHLFLGDLETAAQKQVCRQRLRYRPSPLALNLSISCCLYIVLDLWFNLLVITIAEDTAGYALDWAKSCKLPSLPQSFRCLVLLQHPGTHARSSALNYSLWNWKQFPRVCFKQLNWI